MPTTRTKPEAPLLSPAAHMELWHDYAKTALRGCLAFHGADSSSCSSGAQHIACIADALVEAYIERLTERKEELEALKEKPAKK